MPWDESKHPRHPKGSEDGGEFAEVTDLNELDRMFDESLDGEPTEEEFASLEMWMTDDGAQSINYPLRHMGYEVSNDVKVLDGLFDRVSLSKSLTTYRGVSEDVAHAIWQNRGKTFVDKGFFATSAIKSRASTIGGLFAGPREILTVRLPKGAKALPIDKYSLTGIGEQEVLVARKSKFQVSEDGSTLTWVSSGIEKAWDESKHPRHPKGSEAGGEFRAADDSGVREYLQFIDSHFAGKPTLNKIQLEYGRAWPFDKKSFIGGKRHQCYSNAFSAAFADPDLTYVEGYVSMGGIPIAHAWVVDKAGKVRDVTIKDPKYITGYYGVPIKQDWLSKFLVQTKTYGVFDWMKAEKVLQADPKDYVDTKFRKAKTGKTLYVRRDLLNGDDLAAWAKENGFGTTLPAEYMHVTVLYSKEAVDWSKMGEPNKKGLRVKPASDRKLERLGEKQDAVVLRFESPRLAARHQAMRDLGASSDFEGYKAHVTISWDAPELDVSKVEPFDGELLFGPEIYEEIDEDWKDNLAEKYDANQPRAPKGSEIGGQWVESFNSWFAGSKVVDSAGSPLIAYHGTAKEFAEFNTDQKLPEGANPLWGGDLGSWFTSPQGFGRDYGLWARDGARTAATHFAGKDWRNPMFSQDGARIIPVYLSIKNPMVFEDFDAYEKWMTDGLHPSRKRNATATKAALISDGYDGIHIQRSNSDGHANRADWVAFYPTQIKSAIGNSGTFDPNDPDFVKYSPNQPRHPKGSERGGEWSKGYNAYTDPDASAQGEYPHPSFVRRASARLAKESLKRPLTKEERRWLASYVDDYSSMSLNAWLRNPGALTSGDSIFKKVSLSEPLIVYRGLSSQGWKWFNQHAVKGKKFVDHAYVSTSLDFDIAEGFSNGKVLSIRVPKGSKALPLGRLNRYEAEVLIDRGSRFKVLDVNRKGVKLQLLENVKKYSPDQPRAPKGDDEGGQWIEDDGGFTIHDDGHEVDAKFDERTGGYKTTKPGPAYEAWAKLGADSLKEKLTKEESKVALAYANWAGDYAMNDLLRGLSHRVGPRGNVRERIDLMTSAINKSTLSESITAYRGVDRSAWNFLRDKKVGSTFVDPGFVSVTLRSNLAAGYTRAEEGARKMGALIAVRLPKGSKVLAVRNTGVPPQTELVIQRGSKYKIVDAGGRKIVLELQPPTKKRRSFNAR